MIVQIHRTFNLSRYFQRKMACNFYKVSARCRSTLAKAEQNIKVKSFEEMPGPLSLPLIGTMWNYLPPFGQYSFEKLHRTYFKMHEQYGDCVREAISKERVLVHLFHPKDMQTVYLNEGKCPNRVSHRALAKYRLERPHLYSGPGLFPSNNEEWYRFRHLFQKILIQPSTAESCSESLEDVTDDMIRTIPYRLDKNQEMDLQPLLFSWGLESVGAITLNRRLGCLSLNGNQEAISLVKAAEETHVAVYLTENIPFNFKKNYKKLVAAQDVLTTTVEKYMDEALASADRDKYKSTILHKFCKANGVERRDVFTMILDMFLAGIDTTAFTLSFALYNLALNKRVQDILRSEIMECLPNQDSKLSGTKHKLRYLKAVVDETLRVNPVAVGTGRILPTNLTLGGYLVPEKTMVILQHQTASRQERFFKNAREFEPERWIRREAPHLVSCPFGFGPRVCVGMRIALKELYIAIAKMVRNFEISYHHEEIDSINRLINLPDKPLRLRLKKLIH